jgi:hypothetical protein
MIVWPELIGPLIVAGLVILAIFFAGWYGRRSAHKLQKKEDDS